MENETETDVLTCRFLRQGVPDASEYRRQDETNWRHQAWRCAQVQRVVLVQDDEDEDDDDDDGMVNVTIFLVQDDHWRPGHDERRHFGVAES